MSRGVRVVSSAGALLVACHAPVSGRPVEAPPSASRVLVAGCVGSPYARIQDAITAAVNGDVVEICDGTYAEHLTVSGKALTVRSRNGAAATVIDGGGNGRGLSVVGRANVAVERLGFRDGWTSQKGGNVYCEDSEIRMTEVELTDGVADKGGGLAALRCDGQLTSSTVEGNVAAWAGGGAWVLGDTFEVIDTVLRANASDDVGGGLFVEGGAIVVDNRFELNVATGNGGGAHLREGAVSVRGNDVVGNEGLDGGGIYLFDAVGEVRANTFSDNHAGDEGGGLRLKLSTATVRYNLFLRNQADRDGGGLKLSHEATSVWGNTFDHNRAAEDGGGVALEESASDLVDNLFVSNRADNGGGLYNRTGWDRVLVEDSMFLDNVARKRGGHVFTALELAPTKFRRVDFFGGTAARGGGVFVADGEVELTNVVLDGNTATTSGGGLYSTAATVALTNSVLNGGSAPSGSGLQVRDIVELVVTNTVFADHAAGAAVAVEAGLAPRIRYSDFHGNTSDVAGMNPVVGRDGNLSASPGFADSNAQDFSLAADSVLIDAGDPAVLDLDGSRSDMGVDGGPMAL